MPDKVINLLDNLTVFVFGRIGIKPSFLFCYVYTYTCICPHGRVVIPSAYNFDWDVGCGIDFRIPVSW